MKIEVVNYTDSLAEELAANKVAVVIDVFRATSVITTALANGAEAIIITSEIDEAFAEYLKREQDECVLGGERKMQKIDGFHYGNSPLSYTAKNIKGKTVILTTTNGTKAVKYCCLAKAVFICSLLNCIHVAQELVKYNNDIVIVCAGLNNSISLEDVFCAGVLLSEIRKYLVIELNDFGYIAESTCKKNKQDVLTKSRAYNALITNGFKDDVAFCMQNNLYQVMPEYKKGRVVI